MFIIVRTPARLYFWPFVTGAAQWPAAEDSMVLEEVGSSLTVNCPGWSRDLSVKSWRSQTQFSDLYAPNSLASLEDIQ